MRLRLPFLVSLLVVAAAASIGQKETETGKLTKAEKWWVQVLRRLPPSVTIMPPGKGLCKKYLPRDQCGMRPGGGRGLSQTASRSLVKRLYKRGWTKTKKLPKHVNSIHFCCNGKIFAMEKKPEKPRGPLPPKPFSKLLFDGATVIVEEGEDPGWEITGSFVKEIHGQLGLQDLLEMSYEAGPIEPIVTEEEKESRTMKVWPGTG